MGIGFTLQKGRLSFSSGLMLANCFFQHHHLVSERW